jgi:NAD(P)-dependent dehydrogenase (short-subunit alcohol dehydrogenase family)
MIEASIPRVALVTGGARRIGRAIALALADAGFAVAIHCRDSVADAHDTARAIRSRGRATTVLTADLANEADVKGLIPAAAEALGPVGVLVNNASLFERDEVADVTRASWDAHMEANLRAPFVLMQDFAARLPSAATGVVVNLLDQRVLSPTPHFVSYTLSKMGLWALTQTMALALAPRIRVVGISPGPSVPSPRQTEAQYQKQARSVPLGHGSSPEEIARGVIALLALPSMTGQTLTLDGGQHLQWSPRTGNEPEE